MKALFTKTLVASAIALATLSTAFAADMTGAGSSFIYPVLSKWSEAYKAKTVDFGATDNPVKFDDLEKDGLVQFPAIIGGVVPVVNIEGVQPGKLKLSGQVLADIFSGKVSNWNDKSIAALNPGLKIAAGDITVVTRADGSGTTAIFTDFLSKVSADWKGSVGSGAAVKWPAASTVSGKGNEGVAANVSRVKNSIGYVEFAYAKKNNMSFALVKNSAGQFPSPDDVSFAAASAGTNWAKVPGMGTFITNASGPKAWPISGATFVVIYTNPENKANAAEVLKFFDFAFKEGKNMALELDYVPMPDATTAYIRKNVWSQVKTK